MTDEQKAAYIFSQSVAALAKIEGMKALNMHREARNESMAYTDGDFFDVIDEYQLGHNNIMEIIGGRE